MAPQAEKTMGIHKGEVYFILDMSSKVALVELEGLKI